MKTTTVSACEMWTLLTVSALFLVVFVPYIVTVIKHCPLDDVVAPETATLTTLVNTDRNVVDVNLTISIIVQNPNERQVLSYSRFESEASYSGLTLGSVAMPDFKLGYEESTVLSASFWVQSCYDCVCPLKLGDSTKRQFDVVLVVRRTVLNEWWGWDSSPTLQCQLPLRYVLNGTANTELTDVLSHHLPYGRRIQF